ncbi:MAG: 3-hydroxyacyl-ACP dehydratase FabZ [Coriobacteriales bacterium]|jgi:3-hydroxyacyl-[acyl-carrier-protein] dehydratase|nr:3-hydroxyacyl-ACP dehydratase FabZ [Coriobacteriales bacterium]
MTLDIEAIQEILPHRPPFLLIDRVLEMQPGQYAKAQKCVTAGEPFFAGHFPQQKVMPGVLILEALAQTGAVALLSVPENAGRLAFFGGVKKARFRKPVVPGDVLLLECQITGMRGSIGFGEGRALVDGQLACSAEISFALMAEDPDVPGEDTTGASTPRASTPPANTASENASREDDANG